MKSMSIFGVAALAAFCFGQAQAQFDPGASMDLGAGMGATALGQSTLSGTRNIGQGGHASDELSPTMRKYCAQWPDEGVCKADRARRARGGPQAAAPRRAAEPDQAAMMRSLAPEYRRRIRDHGQAEADRWLAQTAREMGRRDGVAARRAQGR
ncbi:hypothetical protein [Xenophilus sp.]|uniref:hypothetical protein n=1 Tax=Xenophilus sp. TaxID=1873499 RepID=UPI0037DCE8B4